MPADAAYFAVYNQRLAAINFAAAQAKLAICDCCGLLAVTVPF